MDDDQRDAIMRKSRETLDRLNAAERQREFDRLQGGPVEPVYREDALEHWDRLRKQSAEPAKQERSSVLEINLMIVRHEIGQHEQAMRTHISERIDALAVMIGEESGRNEKLLREEYDATIAELRAGIAVLSAELNNRKPRPADEDMQPLRMIGGRDA